MTASNAEDGSDRDGGGEDCARDISTGEPDASHPAEMTLSRRVTLLPVSSDMVNTLVEEGSG
jgi:hypothetical protein